MLEEEEGAGLARVLDEAKRGAEKFRKGRRESVKKVGGDGEIRKKTRVGFGWLGLVSFGLKLARVKRVFLSLNV